MKEATEKNGPMDKVVNSECGTMCGKPQDAIKEPINASCKWDAQRIVEAVSKAMSVPTEAFFEYRHCLPDYTARELAMYLARKYTASSVAELADFFHCSHVGIFYHEFKVKKSLLTDENLCAIVDSIVGRMSGKVPQMSQFGGEA